MHWFSVLGITTVFGLAVAQAQPTIQSLAANVLQATSEEDKVTALIAIAQAIHLGVYKSSGEAVIREAERAPGDYYLYEFEIGMIARSLLRGESWSVSDISRFINDIGLSKSGNSITAEDLRNILARSSTSNRQGAEARSFTGFLGVLAALRETLLPVH